MAILAVESSCDETSAAVVQDGWEVKSNVISTSRKDFEALAGVIPEQAARRQTECIMAVIAEALRVANMHPQSLEAIAVTRGPGLLGSLLVGTATARVLASTMHLPLIGVHHTLGHLDSPWLAQGLVLAGPGKDREPVFPVLTLSVSGGHTDLWYRTSHTHGVLLSRTRDDAAGEAFDKGASMLSLPYPGGPSISKAAEQGNERAFPFPKPLSGDDTLDFSFSGLKTSLKYLLRDLKTPLTDTIVADASASFQFAICEHLKDRLLKALKRFPDTREVHIVGGVSANDRLRASLSDALATQGVTVRVPAELRYCTDNAAMIGAAAHFLLQESSAATAEFETEASIPLESVVTPA